MKGVLGLRRRGGARRTAWSCARAAIRGVESNGMMCSVRELELGDEHDGIIELPADAPVGHEPSRTIAAPARCSTWRSRPTGPIAWA